MFLKLTCICYVILFFSFILLVWYFITGIDYLHEDLKYNYVRIFFQNLPLLPQTLVDRSALWRKNCHYIRHLFASFHYVYYDRLLRILNCWCAIRRIHEFPTYFMCFFHFHTWQNADASYDFSSNDHFPYPRYTDTWFNRWVYIQTSVMMLGGIHEKSWIKIFHGYHLRFILN